MGESKFAKILVFGMKSDVSMGNYKKDFLQFENLCHFAIEKQLTVLNPP